MASLKKFSSCGGNLKSLSRNFSTHPSKSGVTTWFEPQESSRSSQAVGAKNSLLLDSSNFPLPGNVTTQYQYQLNTLSQAVPTDSCLDASDVLTAPSNYQKQMASLRNFAIRQTAPVNSPNPVPSSLVSLECSALDCPELLKKDFLDLFPNVRLTKSPLSVLSFAQKTKSDMGAWSQNMETERDELTADFISTASSICDSLREAGYWADFIDPSSGRPYLGPFTNATLFETDGRLAKLGFEIEDLGCCKVINHHLWGRNVFVATLFTTAPIQSPAVQQLLEMVNITTKSA